MSDPALNPSQPQAAPETFPGKTLGIVAIPVAVFASIVGLILGIVALSQSKKAGYRNTPAKAAIWVGAIVLVLQIIAAVVVVSIIGGVVAQCAELGPGEHLVNGVTYSCG
ncbi:hypothetical protein CLV46_1516 [Diaminobutyricimonas aerilata]|uniref:DUF4190 domain-containing protein n=1 Tax=Diaminobutyricimonas aerilata TaxID=1162967 RepID=A0A2M9CJ81_9MICO|nr:DUF4190 domain-containing protein [Diaminobutyricimonas aerilata]PJJ71957.1 hypothetical protein CLV46_1516 [Diaminobutyricimonas aerilata]